MSEIIAFSLCGLICGLLLKIIFQLAEIRFCLGMIYDKMILWRDR